MAEHVGASPKHSAKSRQAKDGGTTFCFSQTKKAEHSELLKKVQKHSAFFFLSPIMRTTCQADKTNHPVKRAESQ